MKPYRPQKLFTIEEANATLPLVQAITRDLVSLSQDVIERRARLASLNSTLGNKDGEDPYSDEVSQIETDLEADTQRLREYVEELRQIGVEPKSGPDGLIDFPCEMDGRIVYLCWQLGESEVRHWHELDAGYAGRQPFEVVGISGLDGGMDGEDVV
jgi:hypothetical protein